MKTIYFHIGAPKTGTKAIQSFLHRHESALAEQSFSFVRSGRNYNLTHNRLAGDVIQQISRRDGHPLPRHFARQFNLNDSGPGPIKEILAEIEASSLKQHIISAEVFLSFPHYQAIPALIADAFQGFKLRMICYTRAQDAWYESSYNQAVQSKLLRYREGFSTYTKDFLEAEMGNWYQVAQVWAEGIGKENITLRAYENAVSGDGLIPDFLRTLGLPVPEMSSEDEVRRNLSLSRAGLIAQRGLNHLPMPEKLHRKVARSKLFKARSGKANWKGKWCAGTEILATIRKHFEEDNTRLREEFQGSLAGGIRG